MAGKADIVRKLSEELADLPEIADRWLQSLINATSELSEGTLSSTKLAATARSKDLNEAFQNPEYFRKLKNIANEAPEAFTQYEPNELQSVIKEAAEGKSDIAIVKPEDFRLLAARNIEGQIKKETDLLRKDPYANVDLELGSDHIPRINEYLDRFKDKLPFDEVPFLHIDSDMAPGVAQVIGHEGRHRMRALERLLSQEGNKEGTSLLRLIPSEFKKRPRMPFGGKSNFSDPDAVTRVSDDPEAMLHTELSQMQPGEGGERIDPLRKFFMDEAGGKTNQSPDDIVPAGGKSYKPVKDVFKFLTALGVLGPLTGGDDENNN
tara:strand:- start:288 stop:1250 length:963 start_codon:yes stop_codon:yes gene_type:complete